MTIIEDILDDGEYYKEIVPKDTIFIHHTAGSHRPDWTIHGWEKDRNKSGTRLPVATAYVIGGVSTTDGNTSFDGIVYKAFDDKYWAHHLGLTTGNNVALNKKSIGIEICSYGPLTKTKSGIFLNYVNKEVPAHMVGELATPYRGFKYYQKYTPKQIAALKELLLDISKRHNIDLKKGLYQLKSFEQSADALIGKPGLWSHSSVRRDKFDMWPQPELIAMIATL